MSTPLGTVGQSCHLGTVVTYVCYARARTIARALHLTMLGFQVLSNFFPLTHSPSHLLSHSMPFAFLYTNYVRQMQRNPPCAMLLVMLEITLKQLGSKLDTNFKVKFMLC